MWDGYVGRQIERSNRNHLIANTCLLLALVAAAGTSWRYLYNFARGPFPMDRQTLLASTLPGQLQKYYVTVQADKTFDTGIAQYETEEGNAHPRAGDAVTAYYYAAQIGDRLLLVKSPQATQATQFAGALVPTSSEEQMQVVARLEAKNPKLHSAFLPCMLDATGFRNAGYWGLGIGVPLLLLALWNLQKGLARKANPELHPIVMRLARYGSPQTVAMEIESEVSAEAGAPTPGRVLLTRSWLLRPNPWGLDIRRLEDLAWEYKKVTKHSVNFIPTGKTYSVMIWDKEGKSLEISCKELETQAIIAGVQRRVPWVVAGYSKDAQQLWRKQRAQFLQTVEKRRSAYLAQQKQPQQSPAGRPQPVGA
jgi:hypothetical protein